MRIFFRRGSSQSSAYATCSPTSGDPAEDVKDAEFKALQTVAFGLGIYRTFADEHGVDATGEAGITDEAIASALPRLVAGGLGPDDYRAKRSSHTDRLLGLLARAAYADDYLVEDEHYSFVYEGKRNSRLTGIHRPP